MPNLVPVRRVPVVVTKRPDHTPSILMTVVFLWVIVAVVMSLFGRVWLVFNPVVFGLGALIATYATGAILAIWTAVYYVAHPRRVAALIPLAVVVLGAAMVWVCADRLSMAGSWLTFQMMRGDYVEAARRVEGGAGDCGERLQTCRIERMAGNVAIFFPLWTNAGEGAGIVYAPDGPPERMAPGKPQGCFGLGSDFHRCEW